MDRSVGGWMDGLMTNGWIDEWRARQRDVEMDGRVDE